MTAARIARRLARKLAKPVALRWNNWQLKQSREDAAYFESFRALLAQQEQQERVRQIRLQMQRRDIAGW